MIAGSDRWQTAIAEMLHGCGLPRVGELAGHLALATQTIRRDLTALCDQVCAVFYEADLPKRIRRMLDQSGVQFIKSTGVRIP